MTSRTPVAAVISILMSILVLAASSARAGGSRLPGTPWQEHLTVVDAALARSDLSAAVRAWHDAHGAALRTRRWEGLIEVGDAAVRIGETGRPRQPYVAKARKNYRAALFRARSLRSVDGVLRAGEAFAALGDRDVALGALRIARQLLPDDVPAPTRARVQALTGHLRNRGPGAGSEPGIATRLDE